MIAKGWGSGKIWLQNGTGVRGEGAFLHLDHGVAYITKCYQLLRKQSDRMANPAIDPTAQEI